MKTYTTVSVLALLGGSDAFVPAGSFVQPAAHVSLARAAAPAAVRMVVTEQAQTSKVKRNENFGKLTVSKSRRTHVCNHESLCGPYTRCSVVFVRVQSAVQ
jgi:hypothetical protein